MLTVTPEQMDAVKFNTDSFMTLSKIAFSSIERLAALNLSAARAAVDDGFAAASAILQARDTKTSPGATPVKAAESAVAYFRDVQKIAADTQQEINKAVTSYSSHLGVGSAASASWAKGFEMFKGAADQISAMTAANSKAINDAAAPMVGPAESGSRKAA